MNVFKPVTFHDLPSRDELGGPAEVGLLKKDIKNMSTLSYIYLL